MKYIAVGSSKENEKSLIPLFNIGIKPLKKDKYRR